MCSSIVLRCFSNRNILGKTSAKPIRLRSVIGTIDTIPCFSISGPPIPEKRSFALVENNSTIGFASLSLTTESVSFFEVMDKYFGTLCLIIISLSVSIYVGWMMDSSKMVKELEQGCSSFTKPIFGNVAPSDIWVFFLRIICPIVIFIVLLGQFGVEII